MFKLNPNPTFEQHVGGFVPGAPADGLTVEFFHKTREQYDEWVKSFGAEPLIKRMADVIAGWSDAPAEYSEEALEQITSTYPAFPQALYQRYSEALFAVARKN